MAYPYDNNWNWNQNNTQNQGTGGTTPPAQNTGWQNPVQPVQAPQPSSGQTQQPHQASSDQSGQPVTYWNGSTYRSIPQASPAAQPPRKEKKQHKGGRLILKIAAAAMACVMVSAGSIGAFVALVNNGVVKLSVGESGGNTSSTSSNGGATGSNSSISQVSNTGSELTLQEIADKVIPTVVCIQNYQQTGGGQWGMQEGVLQEAGEGSGIIASSDGYIITNAHVVDGADALKVVLSDGTLYEAELIGADVQTDLALIKIDAQDLPVAEFGYSSELQVADMVMAVGNPGGMAFQSSVTIGYVSALNRQVESSDGYTMTYIQTDAAINPGNSGGALVNVYGQVIGINSAKIEDEAYEGLCFAIPIDEAQPIIESLKEYGYVKDRAALGISGTYIDSLSARFYGLTEGMYVGEISNASLSQAGLQKGDVITAINGKDVTSANTISSVVGSMKPGDTVTLEVYRSRSTFTITATLVESTGN